MDDIFIGTGILLKDLGEWHFCWMIPSYVLKIKMKRMRFFFSGKPLSSPSNITLSMTDTTGIEFSATVIAHPEPRFELRYDNGTINNRMMGTLHRNDVNNFTIYFNQTVVEPNDYRTYHLIVSNSFGETAVFVNVLPQSEYS